VLEDPVPDDSRRSGNYSIFSEKGQFAPNNRKLNQRVAGEFP
jgi:hypothetical protein